MDELFADFVPLQLDCLVEHSRVIDGVAECVARLRRRGLKIGSTTGYTREMIDLLLRHADQQGYRPDCAIVPGEVGGGRPHPWMIFENVVRLGVEPLAAVVKIGDTPADVEGKDYKPAFGSSQWPRPAIWSDFPLRIFARFRPAFARRSWRAHDDSCSRPARTR